MVARSYLKALSALAMLMMSAPTPVAAQQMSEGYRFLKAVRDADGVKAQELLNKPGSTVVLSKDFSSGDTALHITTARRDLTWMGFLIGKGANVNATNGQGDTPLMIATQLRFVDGASLLLDHGAQIDRADGTGETPLIRAVHLRDLPLARLLVTRGANPAKRDMTGMSARDYAERDARGSGMIEILAGAKPAGGAIGGSFGRPSGPVQGPKL